MVFVVQEVGFDPSSPGVKMDEEGTLKSYIFKVVVEPDEFEDGTPAFHAYCPTLKGARTHGSEDDRRSVD